MKPSQKFKQPKNKGSIHPLGFVLKYDPPIIGLLYKQSPMDKKKKVYNIHLKELIYHDDEVEITKMLFYEHPKYLDPDIVEPEQVLFKFNFIIKVLSLVSKLLDYRDMKMEEMDEYFLQQGGEEKFQDNSQDEGDETESQYINDDSRDQETFEKEQKLTQLQKIKENEKKKLQQQQSIKKK